MTKEPVIVQIERTQHRRIVFATLTGYWPPDLRQLREESPDKCKISDLDVKNFVCSMTEEERLKTRGKYNQVFIANAQAAIDRITAKELERNPRPPANGRITSGFMSFSKDEVSLDTRPINPDRK